MELFFDGLGDEGGFMTFQEWVKALPEAERAKFFRQIMAVVDAMNRGLDEYQAAIRARGQT
jgi:hypothetical protein